MWVTGDTHNHTQFSDGNQYLPDARLPGLRRLGPRLAGQHRPRRRVGPRRQRRQVHGRHRGQRQRRRLGLGRHARQLGQLQRAARPVPGQGPLPGPRVGRARHRRVEDRGPRHVPAARLGGTDVRHAAWRSATSSSSSTSSTTTSRRRRRSAPSNWAGRSRRHDAQPHRADQGSGDLRQVRPRPRSRQLPRTRYPNSSYSILSHPSRDLLWTALDIRRYNDAAPTVFFGMAGIPGSQKEPPIRGGYDEEFVQRRRHHRLGRSPLRRAPTAAPTTSPPSSAACGTPCSARAASSGSSATPTSTTRPRSSGPASTRRTTPRWPPRRRRASSTACARATRSRSRVSSSTASSSRPRAARQRDDGRHAERSPRAPPSRSPSVGTARTSTTTGDMPKVDHVDLISGNVTGKILAEHPPTRRRPPTRAPRWRRRFYANLGHLTRSCRSSDRRHVLPSAGHQPARGLLARDRRQRQPPDGRHSTLRRTTHAKAGPICGSTPTRSSSTCSERLTGTTARQEGPARASGPAPDLLVSQRRRGTRAEVRPLSRRRSRHGCRHPR